MMHLGRHIVFVPVVSIFSNKLDVFFAFDVHKFIYYLNFHYIIVSKSKGDDRICTG